MIVLGLTGSIGMGKSVAARMLRSLRIPVYDSDAAVRLLLASGGAAVAPVLRRFPGVADRQGGIDRKALAAIVFRDPAARLDLEAIIHPLVRRGQERFLQRRRRDGADLVVLDIPLLFETGAERRVDAVLVVTAPAFIQRQRVLRRGLGEEDFRARLATQVQDGEKRRRADFVVHSGLGRGYTRKELLRIVRRLKGFRP